MMLDRQGRRCALSGWDLTPDTTSLDHCKPLTRNGLHCIENVQLVHEKIQRAKGNMTDEEFVDLCRAVARHRGTPPG